MRPTSLAVAPLVGTRGRGPGGRAETQPGASRALASIYVFYFVRCLRETRASLGASPSEGAELPPQGGGERAPGPGVNPTKHMCMHMHACISAACKWAHALCTVDSEVEMNVNWAVAARHNG